MAAESLDPSKRTDRIRETLRAYEQGEITDSQFEERATRFMRERNGDSVYLKERREREQRVRERMRRVEDRLAQVQHDAENNSD